MILIEYLNRHILIDHGKNKLITEYNEFTKDIIEKSILDSYKRIIAPSIERKIKI
ncbi:MAG: hypothetical protein LBV42_04915 [Methanobrevibacter sp.]|jgi:uncharacterized protein|nr:hypothetical protein [Methanobrevibacter sp.]